MCVHRHRDTHVSVCVYVSVDTRVSTHTHTCRACRRLTCPCCTRHVQTGFVLSASPPPGTRPSLHPRGGCSARAQALGGHGGAAVPEGSARCFPLSSLFPRPVCLPSVSPFGAPCSLQDVSLLGTPWSGCQDSVRALQGARASSPAGKLPVRSQMWCSMVRRNRMQLLKKEKM